MNHHDLPRFAQLLKTLGDTYPRPLTEEQSELYWSILKKYDFSEVEHGIYQHLASPTYCPFMPQVGDIIRWIEHSDEMQALSAWSKVVYAIRTIGSYDSVVFDDVLIHHVISDMGGWIQLCHCHLNDLPFRAIEFQKRYQGLLKVPPQHSLPYLCGMIENINRPLGYHHSPPRLVGDLNKPTQYLAHDHNK